MEFDINRIYNLRKRLKDCYRLIHIEDNERLGHLTSTKTSELNPFLITLSSDLKERFGENSLGNSPHTLRSIFFTDKLTYDGDTINNLELFCSEIEQTNSEIEEESNEIKPQKKAKTRLLLIIGSLFALFFIAYLVLNNMGNRIMDKFDDIVDNEYTSYFNPDPSGKGNGFLTLHSSLDSLAANYDHDRLILPKLKKDEEVIFSIFLYYHNTGLTDIKDVKAKIHINKNEFNDGVVTITGELSGSNVDSIFDTIKIINYDSKSYEVDLIGSWAENTHGETNPQICKGYSYFMDVGNELFQEGFLLGTLDSYDNGWCDQGHIRITYRITNP